MTESGGTVELEAKRLADAIYDVWWDGDGHVCATYRCAECLANALTAVEVVFSQSGRGGSDAG